jgi:hypothetical protein
MPQALYQVKVSVLDIEPLIWRRLIVPRAITLRRMHRVLQATMGWQDYHLYEFQAGEKRYGEPDAAEPEDELLSAGWGRLSWILRSVGEMVMYVYDFGDEWRHQLVLEDLPSANEYRAYPRCLDGARACPPEDIGGPISYSKWLQRLASDVESERNEARWILGKRFDPERFDIRSANRRLKTVTAAHP